MMEMHVSLHFVMSGIYLHIPFCKQACHYCDFHFSTNTALKGELVRAMGEEIALQHDYLRGEPVETIYFGGGTPSLLTTDELGFLMQTLGRYHHIAGDAEITLEANPDDLTMSKLEDLKSLGVNRLSIGIQSFDDDVLKYLNRAHDGRTAVQSVEYARRAGFTNLTIDLIYAIPGMSSQAWESNLSRAIALQPPHISAYTLTIEERTVFGKWLSKGTLKPVGEHLAAEQLELQMTTLADAGYHQYEISNFSLPGYESRHNSNYWKGVPYLGIGPGAHSFDLRTRQANVANNHLYVRALREKKIPFQAEVLSERDRINEYILTSLRTAAGCELSVLKTDLNCDIEALHGRYLSELEAHKLLEIREGRLRLTPAGRLIADRIASDLFLVD